MIANVQSGIGCLKDIKGRNLVYGDPASTSIHLFPKCMLAELGMKSKRGLQRAFVGVHDVVALTVQTGKADAGGLSKTIFKSLIERGVIKPDKVKIVAESEPFPESLGAPI